MNAKRSPHTVGQISRDPAVMLGKPVIAGTRITVERVLEELAAGTTPAELLDAYSHLEAADIQAAVRFALDSLRHESAYPHAEAAT